MKLKLTGLCLMLATTMLLSCKKSATTDQLTNYPQPLEKKIETWLSERSDFRNYQKVVIEGKEIILRQNMEWKRLKYFPAAQTVILPVRIESGTEKLPLFKYLVITMNDAGNIEEGNFYDLLTEHMASIPIAERMIVPELFFHKQIPVDFTGSVIMYDLQNKLLSSVHYASGKMTIKTATVTARQNKTQPTPQNIAPLDPGCSYVMIDWFWQVWINGVLVHEEYIGSSSIIVCEPGGGGGNNGGLTCEQQNENFANQGVAFSGPLTTIDEYNTGQIWVKSYNWPIYKAGTWALFSYERGTLEKKTYPRNIQRWEFTAFEHLHIAEVGTNIGGTRTFTDLGATINITPTRMSVWVQIDFSVTSKAGGLGCFLPPVILAHSANKTFYAPNTFVYERTGKG